MKYAFLLLLAAIFFVVPFSCKKGDNTTVSHSSKKEVAKSKFAKNYPDFNPQVITDILENQIDSDSILAPLYTINNYSPVWMHDTLDTKSLYHFIDILNDAENHGLSPELFSYSLIRSITDSIDNGSYISNTETLYTKIAFLEREATKSAIKYITGMKYGFVKPKKLYKKDYDIIIASPDSTFFKELYVNIKNDPIGTILDSQPKDEVYRKLVEEYKELLKKDSIEFTKILSGDATFKLGSKSKYITDIAKRLSLTGEYTLNNVHADSLHVELDENLLKAINTFRQKNSYPEEQEVGKITIDALNRPFGYYKEKVRANMERHRWKRTKKLHQKHIEVNVAAASLVATQPDSLPLHMRVCIGTIRNKTPLLESDISYLNLNPVWNIPKSIAQGEVAVLQKKDPTYMTKRNMRLYKDGKEVDINSIDWENVNPSRFSYYIRQDPGYGNSLGLIKFMFENAHSVYLHDTPVKSAFNRKNRAVSHGCVRVQKPFDLAFFCLSPCSDIYKDQLLFSAKKEPITQEGKKLLKENKLKKIPDIINMAANNKISLFIDYYTAFMYPNDNNLYFADDIYGYDDLILNSLSGLTKDI